MALRPAAVLPPIVYLRVREPLLRDRRPARAVVRRPQPPKLPPVTVMQRWLDMSA
jgi:hypothetical protein